MRKPLKHLLLGYTLIAGIANAALPQRTFCVFDVVGSQGQVYDIMQDYRLAAMKWGVDLQMKAYTDEKIAAEDFKAGVCDAVAMTGIRARAFNNFTGSIDSIGAIPTEQHMKVVLEKLKSPRLQKFMINGDYEVAGIAPGGATFLFTRDRSIDSIGKLSGKKIAILPYDKSQAILVETVGASPVNVSVSTMGSMFNNGTVDILPLPAVAYNAFELYKGMGDKGAVVNFVMTHLSLQVLIHKSRFPESFGQSSREYVWGQYDRAIELVDKEVKAIDAKYWLELPANDKAEYTELLRQSRLKIRDKGIYDAKMLTFLSRVRCSLDKSLAECSAPDRE